MTRQPRAFLACYLVLIRDGKVLLLRRFNTRYEDGKYSMIAGHVEDGESAWDSMRREAKEEADLNIENGQFKMLHIMHRIDRDREYIDFFIGSNIQQEPKNMEPDKCDELRWAEMKKLPDNMIPYVRLALDYISKGELYSEYRVGAT